MDFRRIKRILIRVLFLNWLVAGAKIIIGFWSGSLGITADGFHSFFDGTSNIIGLLGIKIAQKPKDPCHPYGHSKYEAFASLGILFLITLAIYEFGKNAVKKIFAPTSSEITLIIFGVLIGALMIDYLVAKYEYKEGKKLSSAILIADSLHTKSHIYTTSSVIFGALAIKLGYPIVDPLVALFIIFMLAKLAYEIYTETSSILCDRAFIDIQKILDIVKEFPQIKTAHEIRTRGDHNQIFLDMHIILDPALSLEAAHKISHNLKDKIQKEILEIQDVVIHIEPENKNPLT
jgi:cation diffusion facilitator family transporter